MSFKNTTKNKILFHFKYILKDKIFFAILVSSERNERDFDEYSAWTVLAEECQREYTIKPLDIELIRAWAVKTGAVVTAENHNKIGGLYSAVKEAIARK